MGNTGICDVYKTMEIQNMIKKRGVTRLCHMTEVDNLLSILENHTGILANDYLSEDFCHRNDMDRLDGKTDYISTSIQYPNVWYYNYKKNLGDWCVIFIDVAICRRENTLFCPVNAATGRGAYLGAGVNSLRHSFGDNVKGRLRPKNMLTCCPTDDQAEVMIFKQIPISYITGIAFETMEGIDQFIDIAQERKIEWPPLFLAPILFSTSLSKNIRAGVMPEEVKVEEESALWQKDQCL